MIDVPRVQPHLGAAFFAVAGAVVLGLGPNAFADDGANHRVEQSPPIELGTTGGNVNNIGNAFLQNHRKQFDQIFINKFYLVFEQKIALFFRKF